MNENIDEILEKQRKFFQSGETLPVSFRIAMLKKLRDAVRKYEGEIGDALLADLGKSDYESYMCETGLALTEISYMIKNVRRFARQRRGHTPLAQVPSPR